MDSTAHATLCPDTTRRSALHWLAGYRRSVGASPKLVRIYLAAAALAYVPVLIAAALGRAHLWRTDATSVPFLRDWGFAFGLLVSFPTLLVMIVNDQRALDDALMLVERDGVLERAGMTPASFTADWERSFGITNLWSQIAGLGGGVALAMLTLWMYRTAPAPSWIVPDGHLTAVSALYTYGITLLYSMVIIFIWRSVFISSYLRALVTMTELRLLPFHPDRCGGLRPVGQIGLRNQYVLTTLGVNIVLLLLVWKLRQGQEDTLLPMLISACAVYLVCGPLVFMGPLLPFRDGMLREKRKWSSEVARLLRAEFARLRDAIRDGEIADTDEKVLERLRKFGALIDELPVWPFDARTLRTFATAFVVPIALPLLGKLIQVAIGL